MKEKINEIEEGGISKMRKREDNFRKEMDRKVQSLQKEINNIGVTKKTNEKNNIVQDTALHYAAERV